MARKTPEPNVTLLDRLHAGIHFAKSSINDELAEISTYLFFTLLSKSLSYSLKNGSLSRIDRRNKLAFWNSINAQIILSKLQGLQLKVRGQIIEVPFKNRKLRFYYDSPKQFANTVFLLKEQFLREEYNNLKIKGREVVDIGASIADSPIYFALSGAKQVYAFEPYPYSYQIGKENIRLNNLEKKIQFFNEGCGPVLKNKVINPEFKNYLGSELKNFDSGKRIKIVTLERIVKRHGIRHGILKLDCEGAEYGILLNSSNEVLQAFDQIVIGYHYGHKNLVEKLKDAGFNVNYTNPKYRFSEEKMKKDMYLGSIFAEIN